MTLNIQPKREEAIMKSPEFLKEFNKICEGMGVDGLDVPDQWKSDISLAIREYSFNDLQRMVQLLPQQYCDLVEIKKDNALLLKLGASIILSCKPMVFRSSEYSYIVTSYSTLIEQCNAKFENARKQAVETIYRREMLSGKI